MFCVTDILNNHYIAILIPTAVATKHTKVQFQQLHLVLCAPLYQICFILVPAICCFIGLISAIELASSFACF